jgi:hypothetical protein
LAVSALVDCDPLMGSGPLQPPEPVQAVAFADVQVIVAEEPLFTLLGAAEMPTVGVGALTETVTDWVALAPGPVQVNT